MGEPKITGSANAINNGGIYRTNLFTHSHELIVDELKEHGGFGLGLAPADYLCAALASCKAITVRMVMNRKKWKSRSYH